MATAITIMPTNNIDGWYLKDNRVVAPTMLSASRSFLGVFILVISVTAAYFLSVRSESIGTDTSTYISIFEAINAGYHTRISEPLFVGVAKIVGSFTLDHEAFFFVCAMVLMMSSLYAHGKLISCSVMPACRGEYINYISYGLLFFLPFFFNMSVNIIRHGMAVPFLLVGYILVIEKRYLAACVFLLASLGFHHSSLLNVLLVPLLFISLRTLVFVFIALSVIYLTNISNAILGPIFSFLNMSVLFESVSDYGARSDYRSGVRFDFWLFTAFFVGLSVISALWNVVAEGVARIMIVSFVPFLLFGYIAYSDRLLVFSWFIIPAVAACFASWILSRFERNLLFVIAVLFTLLTYGMFIGRLL